MFYKHAFSYFRRKEINMKIHRILRFTKKDFDGTQFNSDHSLWSSDALHNVNVTYPELDGDPEVPKGQYAE